MRKIQYLKKIGKAQQNGKNKISGIVAAFFLKLVFTNCYYCGIIQSQIKQQKVNFMSFKNLNEFDVSILNHLISGGEISCMYCGMENNHYTIAFFTSMNGSVVNITETLSKTVSCKYDEKLKQLFYFSVNPCAAERILADLTRLLYYYHDELVEIGVNANKISNSDYRDSFKLKLL